jgi:hypothetical protein
VIKQLPQSIKENEMLLHVLLICWNFFLLSYWYCIIPGIKGLITSSRKRRYQWRENDVKVFEDDRGDERDFIEVFSDGKNPWGNLAKSWSNLDKNRSRRNPGTMNPI